jgi:propionyl-CoA carboxylase alpha chain
MRAKIGEAAVQAAKSCGYFNAGTVEFIMDESLNFYFLEMNTRLQVEHPVTEMITGIDLVRAQIRIAEGHPLPFKQEEIEMRGHSIELRVYAEDPQNGFLPDIGKLQRYVRPQGNGIRVDDGFEQGMDIPIFYDPMIAKLIVHAQTREEAIAKMIRAIDEYKITGVANTLAFGKYVCTHDAFCSGKFDTHFVAKYFKPEDLQAQPTEQEIAASFEIIALLHESQANSTNHTTLKEQGVANSASNWSRRKRFGE